MTNTNQQEQLYRWVKASERTPNDDSLMHVRIDGDNRMGNFFHEKYQPMEFYVSGENSYIIPYEKFSGIEWLEPYTPPLEDGKMGAEELTEQQWCEFHTGYYGEEIDKVEQLVQSRMTGRELFEYCQHIIKHFKSQPSTPVQPEETILLNENELKDFDSILVDLNQNKISVDNATEKLLTLIFERKGTPASTPVQDGCKK